MLKGLGQLGDMAKIMKQAQEMQSRMADAQSRLDAIEVVGEAGAGLVRVDRDRQGRGQGAWRSTPRSSCPRSARWSRT